MNTDVMFSRKSDHWSTPKDFYDKLNKEFSFNFDPCPLNSEENYLLRKWWYGRAFVNPPYSNIRAFMEYAIHQLEVGNLEIAVFLVPARTDTKWFHELVIPNAQVRFIKGRLKFGDGKNSAPFPSMICIFERK